MITASALKAVCEITVVAEELGNENLVQNLRWFWEIFEDMNKQDRELMLKFMSGDTRIRHKGKYTIDFDQFYYEDS